MSEHPTIHALMGRVLADLPPVGKNQENKQQGFMFRGHDDVVNALNPLLGKYGVFAMPEVVDRVTAQRQTRNGTVMYEVNLHVRFRFYGPAGDFVECSSWGEGTDMGDKSTNKAMTNAFKYALVQVFAISTKETQESDTDKHSPEETVPRALVPRVFDCPVEGCGFTGTASECKIHAKGEHGWVEGSDGKVRPAGKEGNQGPEEQGGVARPVAGEPSTTDSAHSQPAGRVAAPAGSRRRQPDAIKAPAAEAPAAEVDGLGVLRAEFPGVTDVKTGSML